jgi:uncharacterized protein (TIGR02118 family)
MAVLVSIFWGGSMLKFMPVFANRPDLTREESRRHYRDKHGRLCASIESFNRHMCKYVQNCVIEGTSPHGNTRTVGVSECWFYSLGGFWKAFAEPRYKALREDEVRFSDFNDLLLLAAAPSHVFGPSGGTPVKIMRFATVRPDVDSAEARRFWEADYAREAAGNARLRRAVQSYAQNRPISGFAHDFPVSRTCDIAEEFWLSHRDSWEEAIAAEAELRRQTGYDVLIDEATRMEFLVDSKMLWDIGEKPSNALAALRAPIEAEQLADSPA